MVYDGYCIAVEFKGRVYEIIFEYYGKQHDDLEAYINIRRDISWDVFTKLSENDKQPYINDWLDQQDRDQKKIDYSKTENTNEVIFFKLRESEGFTKYPNEIEVRNYFKWERELRKQFKTKMESLGSDEQLPIFPLGSLTAAQLKSKIDFRGKTVYYSHSMKIYYTSKESIEEGFIKKSLGTSDKNFINPSKDLVYEEGTTGVEIMEICKAAIRESDILIVSEYKEHIGKGVFDEIKTALAEDKLVYVMREGPSGFYFVKVEGVKEVHISDYSVYYGAVVISTSRSSTKEAFDSANLLI